MKCCRRRGAHRRVGAAGLGAQRVHLSLRLVDLGLQGVGAVVGVIPAEDQPPQLVGIGAQIGQIAAGDAVMQGGKGVGNVVVQRDGVRRLTGAAENVLQAAQIGLGLVQLLLDRIARIAGVDPGHRVAHGHRLTVRTQYLSQLGGVLQHRLVPEKPAGGGHLPLGGVAVRRGGGDPRGEGRPHIDAKIGRYAEEEDQYDDACDEGALFHCFVPFGSHASSRSGTGRSGEMVEIACL